MNAEIILRYWLRGNIRKHRHNVCNREVYSNNALESPCQMIQMKFHYNLLCEIVIEISQTTENVLLHKHVLPRVFLLYIVNTFDDRPRP